MPDTRGTAPIQSLDRGLAILEAVGRARRPVSLAELASLLEIDRSSAYRLANTLRRRGFLAQQADSKQYLLGSAVWRLASHFRFRDVIAQTARPYIDRLAAETGETTHLAILEGTTAVLIDHQLSGQAVGVSAGSGFSVPLHCTSIGKALIADLDSRQLVQLLGRGPLPALTKRTIVDIETLAEDCRRSRRRGYSLDDEENHAGVRCVGAALRDASGEVIAAIGVSAPAERLPRPQIAAVGRRVQAIAAELSAKLGFQPSTPDAAAESPAG